MKNSLFLLLVSFFLSASAFAQSEKPSPDISMRAEYGSENADLQSVLAFENINLNKMKFSGANLSGRDFQISIKEFVGGKLTRSEIVFDSKEDEYFRIKSDNFGFRVLAKRTTENTVKFDFQFAGFSKAAEYKINAGHKEFALKTFLGNKPDVSIPLNANTYILTYMMPYVKKDGSKQYCEVAQSGVSPEELGKKYAIPTYFLIDIKFQ